ncbi:MAG: LacI family DNA-binding transcriptional regulator [Victivallales bacterium]
MIRRKKRKESVTLSDVAVLAGVSVSAVSKALLGGGGMTTKVSEGTAEKIREASVKLGYSPNSAARQLKTGKSGIIGAIVHSTAPHVYYDLLGRIQNKLADMGYCFIIGQTDGKAEMVERYLNEFRSRNADVIVSAIHEHRENADRIKAAHARFDNVLYLGRPDIKAASYVESNIADGVSQIVGHLALRGARKIALAIPDYPVRTIMMRRVGYKRGMEENSIPFDESFVFAFPRQSLNPASELARRSLEKGADAVIASNDLVAIQLVREFHSLGARVPEDIRITGFDNMEFAAFVAPSLTTVDLCNDKCADGAVRMIRGFLADGRFPESIEVSQKLIIRESA